MTAGDAIDWWGALKDADWLHVSGITPAVSASAGEAALAALKAAPAAGVKVCFDGNYRSKLWEARGENRTGDPESRCSTMPRSPSSTSATSRLILGRDVARPAAGGAGRLRGLPQPSDDRRNHARDAWRQRLFARRDAVHALRRACQCPAIALPGVVDRIGGGDAFAGGFLYALMQGMPEAEALAFALHSAAAKHGQAGDASHASAADVRALMAGGGFDVKR